MDSLQDLAHRTHDRLRRDGVAVDLGTVYKVLGAKPTRRPLKLMHWIALLFPSTVLLTALYMFAAFQVRNGNVKETLAFIGFATALSGTVFSIGYLIDNGLPWTKKQETRR